MSFKELLVTQNILNMNNGFFKHFHIERWVSNNFLFTKCVSKNKGRLRSKNTDGILTSPKNNIKSSKMEQRVQQYHLTRNGSMCNVWESHFAFSKRSMWSTICFLEPGLEHGSHAMCVCHVLYSLETENTTKSSPLV